MSQFKVTATALNVREKPSLEGKIIGVLKKSEVVDELGLSNDQKWMRVQTNDLVGWSYRKYLTPLETPPLQTIITYKIVSDNGGRLWDTARLACNFWNRYLIPRISIVMRLGVFTSLSNVIATSYKPYTNGDILYGVVEFNTRYLSMFSDAEVVGTIIHELGHTLGMGWDDWMNLFYHDTGVFRPEYIAAVPGLQGMRVELDYGPGTVFAHWDEALFDKEIMSGFKDTGEYVMPVTIDVMKLLGHEVIQHLVQKTSLSNLLQEMRNYQFQMINFAESLDRDYFVPTEVWEEIYTEKRTPLLMNRPAGE